MKTGIIITIYNKEKEIGNGVLERFLENCKNMHVCFVNNGSTDKTIDALNNLIEKFSETMSVVHIKNNKGDESALKVGFRYLLNTKNLTQVSFSNQLNFKDLNVISEFSSKLLKTE